MHTVKYTVTDNDLAPHRATDQSAGIDLKAAETVNIKPLKTYTVKTGVSVQVPENHVGILSIRSGMAAKERFMLANGIGVIDSDYTGEIGVCLYNSAPYAQKIERGQRIAQLTIVPCMIAKLACVNKLDDTERGSGGFGSTGK